MQRMRLTVKQELFCKYIFTPGSETFSNGTKSAREAGYKGTNNYLARVASENVRKCNIITEKQRLQVETEKKLDLSREKQHKKLQQALKLAIKTKSPSAMVSAIREQNEMLGYHRDKAPNTEREAAMLERMSSERKRLADQLALLLTRKPVVSVPVEGSEVSVKAITGRGECNNGI